MIDSGAGETAGFFARLIVSTQSNYVIIDSDSLQTVCHEKFCLSVCSIIIIIHWRIQGGTRDARPPLGPISFIFIQFLANIFSNNRFLAQTQGFAPPRPGNPGSTTVIIIIIIIISSVCLSVCLSHHHQFFMFSFPLIHCDFVVQIVLSVGPNANFIRPITKRKWTRRKWTIRTIRNAHSEELLDHHTLVRHKVLTLPKSSRYGRHKLKVNEEASAENNSGGHHLFITQRDGNSLFLVAKGFK